MLCMHSETCLCCVSCINKLFTSLFVSNVATWSTVCLCVTVVFLSPLYALSIEDYVMSIMVFIHNYVLWPNVHIPFYVLAVFFTKTLLILFFFCVNESGQNMTNVLVLTTLVYSFYLIIGFHEIFFCGYSIVQFFFDLPMQWGLCICACIVLHYQFSYSRIFYVISIMWGKSLSSCRSRVQV